MEKQEYKKIKQIFIANVLECYYEGYQSMNPETAMFWSLHDKLEGNRSLLYDADDKVVVTSVPINRSHLEETLSLMGWKNVHNIHPSSSTHSISYDIVNSPSLNTKIIEIIKSNPGVSLIPYRSTPEFHQLIAYLRDKDLEFQIPETLDEKYSFIHDYSNAKDGFRYLWSLSVPKDLGITTPLGFIAEDKDEAIDAAWWFYVNNKSFVVKYTKGTQGIGILIFKKEELPSIKNLFVEKLNAMLHEDIWDEPVIVVEELIDVDKGNLGGSPSVEFFVDTKGKVTTTYPCEQLLAPDRKTFAGVYIHPELEDNEYIKLAQKAGIYFGNELSSLGYRGNFDIDLVISKDKKLYAVETNLRRTGGTHIHHAATALLGKGYIKKYHVAGEDLKLKLKPTYPEAKERLADLMFPANKGSGFLFANPDMLQVGILNVIIVAKSRSKLLAIRDEIAERLGGA